jgi:cell wall-associated NlpC family hydrolase
MYPWVNKYIGIPFVTNGRTLEGCDCYGLIRLVLLNEYGITMPGLTDDYSDALNFSETSRLFSEQLPILTVEKIKEPQEKAIVIMNENGRNAHIGIVAGTGYILHTGRKTDSVCQRATHPALRNRIEGYYHVR